MKLLQHIVLTVLLIATLAAGAVAAVWRWAPELVVGLNDDMINSYVEAPEERLSELKVLAKESPEAALPGIRALSMELEPYSGNDRLEYTRSSVDRLLVTTLIDVGKTEEGLELGRELASRNEYDHGKYHWVALQFLGAGKPFADEGIEMLDRLFQTFPEDDNLANMLCSALSKNGDDEAALRVVFSHLEALPNESECFRKMPSEWNYSGAARKEDLKAPNTPVKFGARLTQFACQVALPLDVRYVRLMIPSNPVATFGAPILTTAVGKTLEHVGPLEDLSVELDGATLDHQGLVFLGRPDPTITIELPAPPAEGAKGKARLLRIGFPTNRFPHWIEWYLVSDLAAPMVDSIRADAPTSLRAKFFAERVRITRAYALAARGPIFCVDGQKKALVPSTVRDERNAPGAIEPADTPALTFEGQISLQNETETLDLELPAVAGVIVQLEQVEWLDSAGQVVSEPEITVLDPRQLTLVAGETNAWRVVQGAAAPRLRIARPPSTGPNSGLTCQLRGCLR